MANLFELALDGYHNRNYDFRQNGEARVLSSLAEFPLDCFWDVGASIGTWTNGVKHVFPRAAVHAFEIYQVAFDEFQRNTSQLSRVFANKIGLSDHDGFVELHCFGNDLGLSSLFPYPHNHPTRSVECKVTTGDSYVSINGVEHIDFLKIDVEGAEAEVLAGLAKTLDYNNIDIIQFEYGFANILANFLLRDFYQLLQARGYVIGKVYPNYVEFRDYRLTDEDFRGPNYVACRRTRLDYIAALSAR